MRHSIAHLLRRLRRADDGQALVEFALVVPMLLLLLVGIVEFARGWNLHQVITDAAREGARKAVISDPSVTQDSVVNTVKAALKAAGVDSSRSDIVINTPGWDLGTGQPATVEIILPYQLIFFGALKQWSTGESTVTLHTRFTMRNE